MLKFEDVQQSKLVEVGWNFGQSYGGGYIAGQMIMSVIANRVRCGWGPWLDVIQRVPSFMAENEVPKFEFPNVWEGNFVKLLHVVGGVFDGSTPDMSKGALYWADMNRIERPWFKEKVIDPVKEDGLRVHPHCADMNSLWFFR